MNLPGFFSKETWQRRVVDLGWISLMAGGLVVVAILSGIAGMRFAVRSTEVTVPELVGQQVAVAEQLAAQSDLSITVVGDRYDPMVAEGAVVSQLPSPGRTIKARRSVRVIVSLGRHASPVPRLVGSSVRVAELTAREAGYEIGHISSIHDPGVDKDTVIRQDPAPETEGVADPKINILVSLGDPQRYIMPDLTGMNLNSAQPFLDRHGLEVAHVRYRFYSNVRKGTVVQQYPLPGYLLTGSDSISLEVAR